MTNHVHLLLTPCRVDSVGLMMRHLGQEYVQYVNRVHKRSGSLWEGRFHSSLVDSEAYFLVCQRYIDLNPVRAGMVSLPDDYPWSSFNVYAGGRSDSLITPHERYIALGADDEERRARYRSLFAAELDDQVLQTVRAAVNGGYALGNAAFKSDVERLLGRPASPRSRGRPAKSKDPCPS
jgi:putative transposase